MRHLFYTIYGYTYAAVLHERIGPVQILEIPVFLSKKHWPEDYWDKASMMDYPWSEYYLIVPANRYAIENRHADQDEDGKYYQRLLHFRHGGWTTSKRAAYHLLRETERHPEQFRRTDGETIFRKPTDHFTRTQGWRPAA